MSNQHRHPAGTSAGGQFAPGSASEVTDELNEHAAITEHLASNLKHVRPAKPSSFSEILDTETNPICTGLIDARHSAAFGVSEHPDGSYRVRVFHEIDDDVETVYGPYSTHRLTRVDVHLAERVETTGSTEADAAAIQTSIEKLSQHPVVGIVVDDAADADQDHYVREFSFDPGIEARYADEMESL